MIMSRASPSRSQTPVCSIYPICQRASASSRTEVDRYHDQYLQALIESSSFFEYG